MGYFLFIVVGVFGCLMVLNMGFTIWSRIAEMRYLSALAHRLEIEMVPAHQDDGAFDRSAAEGTSDVLFDITRGVDLLAGDWRGQRLHFIRYDLNSTNFSTPRVELAVRARVQPFTFSLRRKTIRWKLLELVGAREVRVDDPEFDRRWHVHTSNPGLFLALMLPELRAKIDRAADAGAVGEYRLNHGWMRYIEQGRFDSPKRVTRYEGLVEVMWELAMAVEMAAKNNVAS